MTRVGIDRILKFAYDLAQSRPKQHLTSATQSNGTAITMPCRQHRPGAQIPKSVRTDAWFGARHRWKKHR